MVGLLDLVLDYDVLVRTRIASENVRAVRPNGNLRVLKLELEPQRFAELLHAFLRRQPRCKMGRLIRPHRPKVDAFQAAKIHWLCSFLVGGLKFSR
ncbi:MAG: hypothetical protein ACOC2N_06750 [Spirochaetota bacterium]